MQKGRTLVEGIKKLWRDKKRITRVPKGVQLLVLTCCVASVTEAICETFGSVMEMMHKVRFFIDWLFDVEYEELKFCTRAYEFGKLGTCLSHQAQETDSKRRNTKPFSFRKKDEMVENLQYLESRRAKD